MKTIFFKFRWKTELQVCHFPVCGRMTWNTKPSSREQNWSQSGKSNILSSTTLTPSSPAPSIRVLFDVVVQHCGLNSGTLLVWSLEPNTVGWKMILSCGPGDMCSKNPFWVTHFFSELPLHNTVYAYWSPVLLWVLARAVLEKPVILLSGSHIA